MFTKHSSRSIIMNVLHRLDNNVQHQQQQLLRHPKYVLIGMAFIIGLSIGMHLFDTCTSNTVASSSRSLSSTSSSSFIHSQQLTTSQHQSVSYELAKEESFHFFDDIPDETWNRYKKRVQNEPMYYHPNKPYYDSKNQPLWLLNNVDPIFTCPHLTRLGGRGDGPKWTCDPHRLLHKEDCLIYSVGSKGIYLFEDAIISSLKENYLYEQQQQQQQQKPSSSSASNSLPHDWKSDCEIHVFDPDPSYAREHDPEKNNIHYHPWGLKSSYEPFEHGSFPKHFQFYSFPEIRQKLNHTQRRIDIFKIDCESCEYSTYQDWIRPKEQVDIRQILVETHKLPSNEKPNQYFDTYTKNGFVLFSKEANTHPEAKPYGVYFEWGYIRLHTNFFQSNHTITTTTTTTTGSSDIQLAPSIA